METETHGSVCLGGEEGARKAIFESSMPLPQRAATQIATGVGANSHALAN